MKLMNILRKKSKPQQANSQARALLCEMYPGYATIADSPLFTPANIKSAIEEYREGKYKELMRLFDLFMDSDDALLSAVSVRKSALKQALWSFGDIPTEKQAYFDAILSRQIGQWADAFIEGKLFGYQFAQIMYDYRTGKYYPTELITYKCVDIRNIGRNLVFYDKDKPVELDPLKWVAYFHKRPELHSVLKYYVFFSFALNNWAQFTETYGKPMRLGKYDSASTADDIAVLRKAVKALGTDQAGVISKETDIEFKDFVGKEGAKNLFEALISFVSDRVTKAVLGQTLSTGQGNGTGSYALAKVHDMVRDDLKLSDIADFRVFAGEIINKVNAINFGGENIEVWFELPKTVDLEKRILIDEKLVNMGLAISIDHFYDTYGVDRPTEGQDVINKGIPIKTNANSSVRASKIIMCSAKPGYPSELNDELQRLQNEIRSLKSIDDLNDYRPAWFVASFGRALSADVVGEYIRGRKEAKPKANRQALPTIKWEWDETSVEAAHNLRNQAMIISGVRTGAALDMLRSEAAGILESGGSFTDFIEKATLNGFAPDNPYHLKTEFETAKAAAIGAGKWDQFQSDKDVFPFLKYVTMRDDLVRDEHLALDGVVASVDDDFWRENYPPNGWNCRCDVEQLTEEEAEAEAGYNMPIPDGGTEPDFRGNTGVSGVLPGNAIKDYHKYATKQGEEANTAGRLLINTSNKISFDALNYPLYLGKFDVAKVIAKPTSIWQAKHVTKYIQERDEDVEIVYSRAGQVYDVEIYPKSAYSNQGKAGFIEYGA